MPVDMSRYPKNWREISHRIRFERAGGKVRSGVSAARRQLIKDLREARKQERIRP